MKMDKKNIGSTLASLFEETGELEEVRERVSKRLFVDQLRSAMKRRKMTLSDMARHMGTSRPVVYGLLDPKETGATLNTLVRASAAVGMVFQPRLVAASKVARRAAPKKSTGSVTIRSAPRPKSRARG